MRRLIVSLAALLLPCGAAVAQGQGPGTGAVYNNPINPSVAPLTFPALSGDCTTSGSTITCTKTNGTAFAPSATTDTTAAGNISSGTLPAGRLPNPSASTLGGIESFASVSHQWINAISTSGVPSATQPACGDLSNGTTGCSTATGTSGATIPLLNGANTWSGVQIFGNADLAITDASAAHNVFIEPNSSVALTADRILTLDLVNAARTFKLGSNLTIATDPGGVTGAVKSNGSGTFAQAACADLSNGAAGCSTALGTGVATALGNNTNSNGGFPTYTAGTWTPAISTDATPGTPAYTVQVGSYEQIGRLVTARFSITLSGWTGSPTGNVTITGLPVTSASTANDFGGCFVWSYVVTGLPASNFGIGGSVATNSTTITLLTNANTTVNNITAAQFGTTGLVRGACNYHT